VAVGQAARRGTRSSRVLFRTAPQTEVRRWSDSWAALTARELEVVLLAAGMPNARIAEQLVVTLDTVKKHVSHLLGKLGAANRTEAVTRARQLSLIP